MPIMRTALAATLILVGLAPASAQLDHGINCDDVRLLSGGERDYWSARFKLSAEQLHLLYEACYQNQFANRDDSPDPINYVS
jgi:hypothetical protein